MAPKATYKELEQKITSLETEAVEYKRLENALKESEERFRLLSEANFEGIVISDNGFFLDANDQFTRMVGCEASDLTGKKVMDFVAPESRDMVLGHIRSGYEQPYEHLAVKADGSIFPVEVCGKTIPYEGRNVRVTAVRDITERKQAEEAIKENEKKFRELAELLPETIYEMDTHGNLAFANQRAFDQFGYLKNDYENGINGFKKKLKRK